MLLPFPFALLVMLTCITWGMSFKLKTGRFSFVVIDVVFIFSLGKLIKVGQLLPQHLRLILIIKALTADVLDPRV